MACPRAAISWSGGKDSCAALHRAAPLFEVVAMITMFDGEGMRSRSHGLRPDVVAAQAERLGLRQVTSRCTWPTYDAAFAAALDEVAADGVTAPFDAALVEDARVYHGVTPVAPLDPAAPAYRDVLVVTFKRM